MPPKTTCTGNLLDATYGIIVHGCNAQGKMGSGVAKEIRARYPQNFDIYAKKHTTQGLKLGEVVWFRVSAEPQLAIANAVTQQYYGRVPGVRYMDYEALRKAFHEIGAVARRHSLPVHYPKIGAALGGGDWDKISKIIDEELRGVEQTLWLWSDPSLTRHHSP